mmetsp:Transcript_7247/g.17668  ORF Transcript_7247/g.17668 Transcript_7247/m.17668 type:complete len:203 (+) Transcript_7247:86-694(+)
MYAVGGAYSSSCPSPDEDDSVSLSAVVGSVSSSVVVVPSTSTSPSAVSGHEYLGQWANRSRASSYSWVSLADSTRIFSLVASVSAFFRRGGTSSSSKIASTSFLRSASHASLWSPKTTSMIMGRMCVDRLSVTPTKSKMPLVKIILRTMSMLQKEGSLRRLSSSESMNACMFSRRPSRRAKSGASRIPWASSYMRWQMRFGT